MSGHSPVSGVLSLRSLVFSLVLPGLELTHLMGQTSTVALTLKRICAVTVCVCVCVCVCVSCQSSRREEKVRHLPHSGSEGEATVSKGALYIDERCFHCYRPMIVSLFFAHGTGRNPLGSSSKFKMG